MVLTKVVAINGSAKMEKGNTARVLAPFLDGMREAGASVELFYAKRLKVKPCMGEFYCWNEKPGVCYQEDDMQMLYPKLREADILVLATPVYIPLPGEMQNLINRLCPLIEPILVWRDGRTRARFHDNVNIRKIVLVSTCGWWEMGNFGTVLRIAEEIAKDVSVEFAGAILRPMLGATEECTP
jgi:multimeric flavodoxin WrbA